MKLRDTYIHWLTPALIVSVFLLLALFYPGLYILATYEDLVGEWMQFYLFLSRAALCAFIVYKKYPNIWFFALLCLVSCYVAMEEISWGQRLLNIDTPAFFLQHNQQRELNLHNLFTGPQQTLLKQFVSTGVLLAILLYGVLLPICQYLRLGLARYLSSKGLLIPPLMFIPYFLFAGLIELELFQFNEAEVAELLLALVMTLLPLRHILHYGVTYRFKARFPLLLLTFSLSTAIATLLGLNFSHLHQDQLTKKWHDGLLYFSHRYAEAGLWRQSSTLYKQLNTIMPYQTGTLRSLARNFRHTGQALQSHKLLWQALELDKAQLANRPLYLPSLLSIIKTLKLQHDYPSANVYQSRALAIARIMAKKQPENAQAFYWLGLIQKEGEDYPAAITALEYALKLRPNTVEIYRALEAAKTQL